MVLKLGIFFRFDVERRKKLSLTIAGGAQRDAIKEHIVDKILNLACPRCGQAFVDFNGCMALTCSRAGCGCGFCALCQEDCGNDAHAHLGRGCPIAAQVGVKPKEFYMDEREWPKVSSKTKGLKLKAYLDTLTESQRQHALADCANELAALNLRPGDFGAADAAAAPLGGLREGAVRLLRRRLRFFPGAILLPCISSTSSTSQSNGVVSSLCFYIVLIGLDIRYYLPYLVPLHHFKF